MMMRYFKYIISFCLAVTLPVPAHAVCTNPNGVAGSFAFVNGAYNMCNGSSWNSLPCESFAQAMGKVTIFLTSPTGSNQTWTVPDDWNSANNSIEVIGAGGGGSSFSSGGGAG